MDRERFTYTTGLDDAELRELLGNHGHGVLSLARDDDGYGIPVAYFYDPEAGTVFFRFGMTHDSAKREFLDATDTATLVVYDAEPTDDPKELDSWSILLQGPLRTAEESELEEFDVVEVNRRFSPLRVFDESIDDIDVLIYALDAESVTGRKTTE